jgi:arsenate reductase-like glutaredoxin family protein
VKAWLEQARWDELVNTKGNTFRQLPPARQQGIDAKRAAALMLEAPSVIKRPVIETDRGLLLGFDPERYRAALGKHTRASGKR